MKAKFYLRSRYLPVIVRFARSRLRHGSGGAFAAGSGGTAMGRCSSAAALSCTAGFCRGCGDFDDTGSDLILESAAGAGFQGGFDESRWIDNLTVSTLGDIPAVPLPATLPLLAGGLGGLAMFRRRQAA
ncbi:MAG: VPLPA-CTERM sorting domain-containing protein [Tranquillimonas sp.]